MRSDGQPHPRVGHLSQSDIYNLVYRRYADDSGHSFADERDGQDGYVEQ